MISTKAVSAWYLSRLEDDLDVDSPKRQRRELDCYEAM